MLTYHHDRDGNLLSVTNEKNPAPDAFERAAELFYDMVRPDPCAKCSWASADACKSCERRSTNALR